MDFYSMRYLIDFFGLTVYYIPNQNKSAKIVIVMKPNELLIRIFILAFFILLLNSWLQTHVENNVFQLLVTNGLLALFSLASLIQKMRNKTEQENINNVFRNWLNVLISTPVLTFLFLLLIVSSSFVSSVTIITKDQSSKIEILVLKPGNPNFSKKGETGNHSETQSFTLFTNPFGKNFKLKTTGFQDYNFQVFPWLGKKIIIEEDLNVSPTVILRISEGYFSLANKTQVKIYYNDSTYTSMLNDKKLIIIGQNKTIPFEYFNSWNFELRARGKDEQATYKNLYSWWYLEPYFVPFQLYTGDSINVVLSVIEDQVTADYASYSGTIRNTQFQELKNKLQ